LWIFDLKFGIWDLFMPVAGGYYTLFTFSHSGRNGAAKESCIQSLRRNIVAFAAGNIADFFGR